MLCDQTISSSFKKTPKIRHRSTALDLRIVSYPVVCEKKRDRGDKVKEGGGLSGKLRLRNEGNARGGGEGEDVFECASRMRMPWPLKEK